MKSSPRWSRVLFLALLALSVGQLSALDTLIVVGNAAPPFRIFDQGKASGLYVEIMNAVAARAGVAVEYREMPMARALVEMERGSADVMLGPLKTPEREAFLLFLTSTPLPREDKGVYLPASAPDVHTLGELSGKVVGVLRGASYSPGFDADTSIIRHEVNDYAAALQMVSAGRLDAVLIPERQATYLLKSLHLSVQKASWTVAGTDAYIAVSRKSMLAIALVSRLQKVFHGLESDGTIARILASYF